MKLLTLFFIITSFVMVAGCGGGNNGSSTNTEETGTTDESEGSKGPITIVTGSGKLTHGNDYLDVAGFKIPKTGVIQARVEWNSPPLTLSVGLYHSSGVGVEQSYIQSPAILQLQATKDLLDMDNEWAINVSDTNNNEVTFNYTVTLFPD